MTLPPSIIVAYTLFGNMVIPNHHALYNPINQLILTTNPSSTDYTYFANHLLASAYQGTHKNYYYYNHQLQRQQGLIAYLPILISTHQTPSLYVNNRHHSIILSMSSTHIVVKQFSPYGIALLPQKTPYNPLGYSGYQHDAFSHLYLLANRDYAPRYRTFLSRDTQDLPNRYQYGNDNPLMGRDPSGHVFEIEEAKTILSEATGVASHHFHYLGEGKEGIVFTEEAPTPKKVYKLYKKPEQAERNVALLNQYMSGIKTKLLGELPENKDPELAELAFNTQLWPSDASVNTQDPRIEYRPYWPGKILTASDNWDEILTGQEALLATQGRLVGDPSGNFIQTHPQHMQYYFGQDFPLCFDLGNSFQVVGTPDAISKTDISVYAIQLVLKGHYDLNLLGFPQYSDIIKTAYQNFLDTPLEDLEESEDETL